jgi:hypothetical protein
VPVHCTYMVVFCMGEDALLVIPCLFAPPKKDVQFAGREESSELGPRFVPSDDSIVTVRSM